MLSPESEGIGGQSETLGFVLLFSIVVFGGVTVLSIGSLAVSDTQEQLTTDRAENTLTQLASDGALVAFGGTDNQELSLPDTDGETYAVDETAGRMTVEYADENKFEEIANVTLGEIRYEGNDGTIISYQGGGVWRTSENGGSTMVSPPEFHYRATTLTLPIVTIDDTGQISDNTQLEQQNQSSIFPPGNNITNPLRQGEVNVTVTSQYYQAWGSYFQERTTGGVSYDDANSSVTVRLLVPFKENFDNPVAVTDDSDNAIDPKGGSVPSDWATGANYPLVDSTIEQQISDCLDDNNNCENLSVSSGINDEGTYYYDGTLTQGFEIDNPGGNVSVVIDNSVDLTGNSDIETTDLSNNTSVTFYVRDDFNFQTNINDGSDPSKFITFVHSDGSITDGGSAKYVGIMYAPESNCEMKGNSAYKGAIICETITDRGNPATNVEYDPKLSDVGYYIQTGDLSFLTYIHVSEYNIGISSN